LTERSADLAPWISDGEKYHRPQCENHRPDRDGRASASFFVLANTKFNIPAHWREWLGSIRADEVERSDLFLISKPSKPYVLDNENQRLQERVSNLYVGLMLVSRFASAYRPVMLSGSRRDGEVGIRQQHDFDSPVPCLFRGYPAVVKADIELAAQLGGQIEAIGTAPLKGGHWRLFRTLGIYRDTRTVQDILDRLHQYARCIDGLILPDTGKTKQQFKSRTELFIGPRHHELMGDIYDVRSAVEHLHENRYLEGFDRDTRLDLVKKEAVVEHIARTALARIIGNPDLWQHFANTELLASFWKRAPNERQQIWGEPSIPWWRLRTSIRNTSMTVAAGLHRPASLTSPLSDCLAGASKTFRRTTSCVCGVY
jgi:hypothetical protein